MNPVQLFYLEQHADALTAEQLAEALGVPLKAVRAALKKHRAAKAALAQASAPAEAPKPPPKAKPAPAIPGKRGAVYMTEAQAESVARRNRAKISSRLRGDVTVVDPSKPVY